jgi:tetratricopeptide (TPR) repeat protein
MFKRYFFLFILVSAVTLAKAQTTDTVLLNKLGDFDMAILTDDNYGALTVGEEILADTAKLSPKGRTAFFAKLAKAYDDAEQYTKAITYFEKVAAAEPDYYVARRSLGYLYNDRAEDIQLKLYRTPANDPSYPQIADAYKKAVLRALAHLEKAQACDPDDDTLDLIKTLYNNIHDDAGISTLKNRLPGLAKKCVDLLEDK